MKTLARSVTTALLPVLFLALVGCEAPTPGPPSLPTDQWQWKQQFGTDQLDTGGGLAHDGAGNLYMCGWLQPGWGEAPQGAWLAKFTSDGEQLWYRRLLEDEVFLSGLAVDGKGHCYLTGWIKRSENAVAGYLVKYGPHGQRQWRRTVDSGQSETLRAVAVDRHGNCFVAGDTMGDWVGANRGGLDILVLQYDAAGTLQRRWQFGTEEIDYATRIAITTGGDVFVAGLTDGQLGQQSIGGRDFFVAKLADESEAEWVRQFGSDSWDHNVSLSVTSKAGCIVAGSCTQPVGAEEMVRPWDVFLIAYDHSGHERWRTQHGIGDSLTLGGSAIDEGVGIVSVVGRALPEVDYGAPDAPPLPQNLSPPDRDQQVCVLTWDLDGTFLDAVLVGTPKWDGASRACFGRDGDSFYVAGTTYGILGAESFGDGDAFLGELAREPLGPAVEERR